MIANKKEPAAGGGLATGSKQNNLQIENISSVLERQEETTPFAGLSALVEQYKGNLLTLPYSKHISRLVDCCDCILDEIGGADGR